MQYIFNQIISISFHGESEYANENENVYLRTGCETDYGIHAKKLHDRLREDG